MTFHSLLPMTAPLREDFYIPYHDLGPQNMPPVLALVGGLNGNELNSVSILSHVAGYLKQVEKGRVPGQQLSQRILIVPVINTLGLNTRSHFWPFDKTPINRMFPGFDQGETTQRIAYAVLQLTRSANCRISLRSSHLDREELPQVKLYQPTDDEQSKARWFSLPAIRERPITPIFSSTLGQAWKKLGGENFFIEVGQAGNLQTHHCETAFRAILHFLDRSGILLGLNVAEVEEEPRYFRIDQSFPLLSERAGFFVSKLKVGRWVRKGESLGFIYDPFNGEIKAEIQSSHSGLLSSIRRQPLLFEGDVIARIETQ